ncbi:MAG TPA: ABC transporter substrate-binding protein [Gammaproteobacteria bacterium]|nr:ABC transporter substrate-binding protein [Gammaproteobacteria bacterium]
MIPQRFYILVLPLLLLLGSVSPAQAAQAPDVLIKNTTEEMLTALDKHSKELKKDPTLIYGLVSDIVLPHFDFIRMSRSVLAQNWRKASFKQKLGFVRAFRTLMVRTYAVALLEYTNQKIHVLPAKLRAGEKNATVRMEVLQQGKPPAIINYRLHLKKKGWKVYDVATDGISLITNYRTSFASEIKQKGLDALIARLQKHNEKADK